MVRSYMRHGPTQVCLVANLISTTKLTLLRLSEWSARLPLILAMTDAWLMLLDGKMCWYGMSNSVRWYVSVVYRSFKQTGSWSAVPLYPHLHQSLY
jgi:hypothetical protein